MLQLVLAVRGPVLESPQNLHDLGVDVVQRETVEGFLGRLLHLLLHRLLALLDDLLDPSRMDPSVLDEAFQGDARHLAAHRVVPGQDDGLRRVVDDHVDPRRLLEGADVPTLTTDDSALHLVGRKLDDRHRKLSGFFGRHALNRHGDDPLRLTLSRTLGLFLDLPQGVGRFGPGLVLEILDQLSPSVRGGDAGCRLESMTELGLGLSRFGEPFLGFGIESIETALPILLGPGPGHRVGRTCGPAFRYAPRGDARPVQDPLGAAPLLSPTPPGGETPLPCPPTPLPAAGTQRPPRPSGECERPRPALPPAPFPAVCVPGFSRRRTRGLRRLQPPQPPGRYLAGPCILSKPGTARPIGIRRTQARDTLDPGPIPPGYYGFSTGGQQADSTGASRPSGPGPTGRPGVRSRRPSGT